MLEIDRAIQAIKARQQGIWDDPSLMSYGALLPNEAEDVQYIKRDCLMSYGFKVGTRDPRLNTNYPGKYMVVEAHEEFELPTKDGSNGPWCVVGDNLSELVDQAFEFLDSIILREEN